MERLFALDGVHRLQFDVPVAKVVEQPRAGAEQYRYELYLDLIRQFGADRLLHHLGAP